MNKRYLVRAADVAAYSPANHTGTSNQRIVGRETVGARHVEVLIGTIVKGHGALKHAHPTLEQASLLLEGLGLSESAGVEREVGPGHWGFNAQGEFHRFSVISDAPVKVLVVYAPPYSENPNAAVLFDAASTELQWTPAERMPVAGDEPAFTPRDQVGISYRPVISRATTGARHMAIFDAHMRTGAQAHAQSLSGIEQVLFLRSGALSGTIEDSAFEALPGDFVFIPDGATHEYQATSDTQACVIHAFGPAP